MTQGTHPRPAERLEIDNFLVIKKAHFDVKAINVIIGEQASGKSIIAKVLHIMRDVFYGDMLHPWIVLSRKNPQLSLSKNLEKDFSLDVFKENTLIKYEIKDFSKCYSITISKEHDELKISVSDDLKALQNEIILQQENEAQHEHDNTIYKHPVQQFIKESVFIPASRSLLAIVQDNAPDFAGYLKLKDRYLIDLWRLYNSYKETHIIDKPSSQLHLQYQHLMKSIMKGEYAQVNKSDYIIMDYDGTKKHVALANTSSAQQEVLPMLMVLQCVFFTQTNAFFFLEEPEAHLFPTAQKDIMSIIGLLYNQGNSFFLTTHSPYILVALNNLIMAGNVAREHPDKKEDVDKIIPKDMQVNFEDVGAYTIENGELKTILNDKTHLINAETLDAVSKDFRLEFQKLLSLTAG